MRSAYSFNLESEYSRIAMAMLMAVLAVYWLALLSLMYHSEKVVPGIKLLLVMAAGLLAVKGMRQAAALATGARVMGKMQAPQRLRRSWLYASLMSTTYAWGFFVAGGTVLLALSQSSWKWTMAAALFSTILCLATIAVLSRYGMLHRTWSWIISLGSLALVVATSLTIGISAGLDLFGELPMAFQLMLAISWPLLAYRLALNWSNEQPIGVFATREANDGVWARFAGYARRYTILQPAKAAHSGPPTSFQSSPFRAFVLVANPLCMFLAMGQQYLAAPWGSKIGALHIVVLGFVTLYCSWSIVCKDLHWRMVLAPGGLYRGKIGGHILRSTLTLQYTMLLILLLICAVSAWAAFDIPFKRDVEWISKFCVFPIEMLFATTLAVTLRGTGLPMLFIGLFSSLLIICMGTLLWMYGLKHQPELLAVGPTYVCLLLSTTALLIMLSNRLWTIKKLFRFRNWA